MLIDKLKIYCKSIFQPIPSMYDDNLTYIEYLMALLKKLNEVIGQINEHSTFIAEFNEKYQQLLNEFDQVKQKVDVELPAYIDRRLGEIRTELQILVNAAIAEVNARITNEAARLDARIDNVAIGKISVLDPTTGLVSDLQVVINNLAGQSRDDVLTADEFDDLELTCSAFEAYDITAFNFDYHNKSILV